VGWTVLVACGFDTGGVASGSASVGDAGTTSADDSGAETFSSLDSSASSAGTNPGSSDPSASVTTDASASSDGGPASADVSTDPSAGDSAGSSGAGETTTTAGSASDATATGTTTLPTTTESGGSSDDPGFPNCSRPNVCADPNQNCLEVADNLGAIVANICVPVPGCLGDGECPQPATGTAVSYCSGYFNGCMLDCNGGATCPDNMQCYDIGGGYFRCFYPT
jgi:hypothetical protein